MSDSWLLSVVAMQVLSVDTGDNQEEQADRSLELHIDRAVHAQDAHELASQTISRQSAMYQVILMQWYSLGYKRSSDPASFPLTLQQ